MIFKLHDLLVPICQESFRPASDHLCLALFILSLSGFSIDLLYGCPVFVLKDSQLLGLQKHLGLLVFPLLLETLSLVADRLEVWCPSIEPLLGRLLSLLLLKFFLQIFDLLAELEVQLF